METWLPIVIIFAILLGIFIVARKEAKKVEHEFKPPAEPPKLEDEEGDLR